VTTIPKLLRLRKAPVEFAQKIAGKGKRKGSSTNGHSKEDYQVF